MKSHFGPFGFGQRQEKLMVFLDGEAPLGIGKRLARQADLRQRAVCGCAVGLHDRLAGEQARYFHHGLRPLPTSSYATGATL